jgi:hypothetical protein
VSKGKLSSWLQAIYLALIGTITALLTLGEKVEALADSSAWIIVYAGMDFFKYEIVGTLILLLLFNRARPAIRQIRNELSSSTAWSSRRWLEARFVEGICVLLLIISGYTTYEYAVGKRVYIANYDRVLLKRANHAFHRGRASTAGAHLRVCVKLLRSPECEEAQRALSTRVSTADALRSLYRRLSNDNSQKLNLLHQIYLLDRDTVAFSGAISIYRSQIGQVRKLYSSALQDILSRNHDAALAKLRSIQRQYPGYGDCHALVEELGRLQAAGGINESTPHLLALVRYGEVEFSSLAIHEDLDEFLAAVNGQDQEDNEEPDESY